MKGVSCSEATLRARQRLARHWKKPTVTKADEAGLGYNAAIRLLALDAAAIRSKGQADSLRNLRDRLIDQLGGKKVKPAKAWQRVRDAADKTRVKHDGYARCRLRDTKCACLSSLGGLIGRLEGVRPYVPTDQMKPIDKMIKCAHWLTTQVGALRNRVVGRDRTGTACQGTAAAGP